MDDGFEVMSWIELGIWKIRLESFLRIKSGVREAERNDIVSKIMCGFACESGKFI